jgi:hypothetical protein
MAITLPVAITVTALDGGTVLLDDLVVEAW